MVREGTRVYSKGADPRARQHRARELGLEEDAAILAAVLEASQPIWRNRMEPSVDIREQVELVRAAMRGDMMLSDSGALEGIPYVRC